MVINVKISLCKITAASKLFQRNYYLPLLKPLSPKDALRRKIITGQNILGNRIEHYIPVLIRHDDKTAERKRRGKGVPVIKKRVKRKESERYLEPFLDDDMENHGILQGILARKSKGKGQHYIYEIPDKKCILVVNSQMEKAIKDRDIIDITVAQRSEKILVKVSNGTRVTVPIASFKSDGPLYKGSGWTQEQVEEEHHHGKETMSIAKLFEAKESGVEEWELEMMRLANKRKKKHKGEASADWKQMLQATADNIDWDQFEEDTKEIIDHVEEVVEEEDIPMAVDDMEKTRNVGEKLKQGGEEILNQLPLMKEIPSVIKNLENGVICELVNVSGAMVTIDSGKQCFVTGQMVKTDDNEVFIPGQTIENEEGVSEYTPGITVFMDNEPTLIPGLVFGEEEQPAVFLPGESTITEEGQLKFESTEEDKPVSQRKRRSLSDSPPPPPKPKPKKVEEEIVIKRRTFDEPEEPLIKERVKKRAPIEMKKEPSPVRRTIESFRPQRQPVDDTLLLLEEQRKKREEEDRKRLKEREQEKILKEEGKVDKLRMTIRKKIKDFKIEAPAPYVPVEPIKKSQKLEELEQSIKSGTFFEDDKTKQILEKARSQTRLLKYQHALNYGSEFGKIRY